MVEVEKEISKEVYGRAKANRDRICDEDEEKVFGNSTLYGYGVYGNFVFMRDGKYMVKYNRGETCD